MAVAPDLLHASKCGRPGSEGTAIHVAIRSVLGPHVGSTMAPMNVIRPPADGSIDPLAAAARGMHSIPTRATPTNSKQLDRLIPHLAVPHSYYGVPKCHRHHESKSLEQKSARTPVCTEIANRVTLFRCERRVWRGGHYGDVKLPPGVYRPAVAGLKGRT
jgi:hypothetical protein